MANMLAGMPPDEGHHATHVPGVATGFSIATDGLMAPLLSLGTRLDHLQECVLPGGKATPGERHNEAMERFCVNPLGAKYSTVL